MSVRRRNSPLCLSCGGMRIHATDRFHQRPGHPTHKRCTCKNHLIDICREMKTVNTAISETVNKSEKKVHKIVCKQDPEHHFIYTRWMRFREGRECVEKQLYALMAACPNGMTIMRDMEFRRAVYVPIVCPPCGPGGGPRRETDGAGAAEGGAEGAE